LIRIISSPSSLLKNTDKDFLSVPASPSVSGSKSAASFLLNKIQLKHDFSEDEIAYLKRKHWISGRKDSLLRSGSDKGGYWQVNKNKKLINN